MGFNAFIGVDVSKEKLDFVVVEEGRQLFHMETENTKKGIEKFFKRMGNAGAPKEDWLLCMEHTGIYCNPLLKAAQSKGLAVWVEHAARIKAFHGLQREKNDKLDALRIAEYAFAKRHAVTLWEPPREVVLRIKSLIKLRDRLVDAKKRLTAPVTEEKRFGDREWAKELERMMGNTVSNLDRRIQGTEKAIMGLIKSDENLKVLYDRISSVKGVGLIVAINTIVVTNEFKKISDPRKMACHCGVAPFRQLSGKSLRGRSKVSHRANKHMKALFNMSARSVVACEGELRDYYRNKIKKGKNKMSVMNAIRNKIIHRIFACVRDQREYENIYVHSFV